MGLLAFIILLPIIVFVHELGHFVFARINGVRVEAFAIGFGKKLFGWKDSYGTEWKVCIIPLGGYVRMLGQSDMPEKAETKAGAIKKLSNKDKSEHFEFKKRYQKASIAFAGPFFNFIFALVVFFALFFFGGVPNTPAVVQYVSPNSAAFIAGVKEGDELIKLDIMEIDSIEDVASVMQKADGTPFKMVVNRNGEPITLSLTPKKEGEKYMLGISYSAVFKDYQKVGFLESVVLSYDAVSGIVVKTLGAIGEMIVGDRSSKELGGIIAIAQIAGDSLSNGFYSFLYLMAFISVSLGLFNLFPIPVLDGGHLLIYTIEGILRRDLSEKIKEKMFFVGFIFIIFLLLLSNINDILRLIK